MKTKNLFTVILYLILLVSFTKAQIWEQTNGPYTARITSMAVHPNGDLYACEYNKGLLRSTDNGDSWTSIAFIGRDLKKIFISSVGYIFVDFEGTVIRSTDNGIIWHFLNINLTNPTCIDSDNFGNIYISYPENIPPSSKYTIFRSTDSGDSWTVWSYFNGNAPNDLLFVDSNNHILLSDKSNSIYRLINNNWVNYLLTNTPGIGTTCIVPVQGNILLAGTTLNWPPVSNTGIYKSSDFGITWQRIISNGIEENQNVSSIVVNSSGIIFAGTSNGVYKSTDNGMDWIPIGMQSASINNMVSYFPSFILAGSASGGIRRWNDAENIWEDLNTGIIVDLIISLGYSQIINQYFVVTRNGMFRSNNRGENWETILSRSFPPDFSSEIRKISLLINSNFLFVSRFNQLYRSTNNGTNWEIFDLPAGNVFTIINTSQPDIIWGGGSYQNFSYGGAIYESDDNGITWSEIYVTGSPIKSLVIGNVAGNYFAGTLESGVYRSTDWGSNWRTYNIGLLNNSVESIQINSHGDIFIGTHNGIYRSIDNGGNWKFVGLDSDTIITIAINSIDHILAGTMSGHVYISRDNGATWNDYSSGLNTTQVRCITLDENDFAMVGTASSGVYRSVNSTVDIRESDNIIVTSFDLFQNYPNPFNPGTVISYQLPVNSDVMLKVFDVLGNEITTLVDEYKPAGRYEVEFDGSSLASGIYFYKMQAGEYVAVKKMILIK